MGKLLPERTDNGNMNLKLYILTAGMFGILLQWLISNHYIEPFLAIMVVFTMDTALGVVNAIKNKKFSSRGFSNIFVKIILYFGSILTLVLLHKLLTLQILKEAINIIIGGVIFNELVSVAENIFILSPKAQMVVNKVFNVMGKLKNSIKK